MAAGLATYLPGGSATHELTTSGCASAPQVSDADAETHRPLPDSGEEIDDFLTALHALTATIKVEPAVGLFDIDNWQSPMVCAGDLDRQCRQSLVHGWLHVLCPSSAALHMPMGCGQMLCVCVLQKPAGDVEPHTDVPGEGKGEGPVVVHKMAKSKVHTAAQTAWPNGNCGQGRSKVIRNRRCMQPRLVRSSLGAAFMRRGDPVA